MAITKQASPDLMGTIRNILDECNMEKAAGEGGQSDPGTTHPVKNAPDNTQGASEGARSKENEADVKANVGAPSVNGDGTKGPDNSTKGQGMEISTADETKGNVQTPKGDKEVPPSSLPGAPATKYSALADTGNKILSVMNAFMAQAEKEAAKKGGPFSEPLKPLAADEPVKVDKCEKCGNGPCTCVGEVKESAEKYAADAEAGYLAANAAAEQLGLTKVSAAQVEIVASLVKAAEEDATNVVNYYAGYRKGEIEKAAEEAAGETAEGVGDGSQVAPVPPEEEAALAASGAGGGAPAGAGDGAPAGGEGAGMEAAIAQFVQALEQSGLSPEEANQLIEQVLSQAQAEGGAPEAGAEANPGAGIEAAKVAELRRSSQTKLAAALKGRSQEKQASLVRAIHTKAQATAQARAKK